MSISTHPVVGSYVQRRRDELFESENVLEYLYVDTKGIPTIGHANNRRIDRLQMVIEGTSDYLPGGGDVTRDNKVETFNFEGLVAAFDAARAANPGITSWALTNALTAQYLTGSDTAAIGGDLAYQYHLVGSLSDISFNPALTILGDAAFVTGAQTLQGTGNLQDATPRLG